MPRIEVVRSGSIPRGTSTPGIIRERAFEGHSIFSRSTVEPGVVTGWHHHGSRDLYGYVVVGTLLLEHGKGGAEAARLEEGDFFHVPPGLVHRDHNPSETEPVVIVNLLVGEGDALVNVPSPD